MFKNKHVDFFKIWSMNCFFIWYMKLRKILQSSVVESKTEISSFDFLNYYDHLAHGVATTVVKAGIWNNTCYNYSFYKKIFVVVRRVEMIT